jgi:hypothetical protein
MGVHLFAVPGALSARMDMRATRNRAKAKLWSAFLSQKSADFCGMRSAARKAVLILSYIAVCEGREASAFRCGDRDFQWAWG